MKWANTTSNHAICQIDKNIYIFERPLDNLVNEGAITAQTKTDLTRLGGLPTSDNWESFNLQAPLTNPSKIICLGLNYTDHAQEVGVQLPKNPTLFTKYSNALIGPYDTIHLPPESTKIDWEAELCLVIGQRARRLTLQEASSAIWGYTVMNDISVRDWQGRTSEWFQGKNWDKTTPFGPAIVTADELDLDRGLNITCTVDGEVRQKGNTAAMIFNPAEVVSYISTFMTLEPGDFIALGTPSGVGLSLHPRKWLADGQTVVTEIEGIGALTNICQLEDLQ